MDTPNGTVGLGSVGTQDAPRPEGTAQRALRPGPAVTHNAVALEQCLLLALGTPVEITSAEWPAVFETAVAERCAALAWLRSESRIRTAAPAAIGGRWADWIAAHMARTEQQLEQTAQIDQWLSAHGISAVVLKGIPLASRLYGSWWARTINDVDLYVAPAECSAAADILRATGWTHLRGVAPADVEFVKQVAGRPLMAELHTSLTGSWFDGHPFPAPEHEVMTIHGLKLRAHSGHFVPAYLASHLLQHSERPLLWILDFHTLWSGMLEEHREAARRSAAAARVAGVLALAERWSAMIDAIERAREPAAVERLKREALRPSPVAAFSQIARTASTAADLARVAFQLLWPLELRGEPRMALQFWGARIRRRLLRSSAIRET